MATSIPVLIIACRRSCAQALEATVTQSQVPSPAHMGMHMLCRHFLPEPNFQACFNTQRHCRRDNWPRDTKGKKIYGRVSTWAKGTLGGSTKAGLTCWINECDERSATHGLRVPESLLLCLLTPPPKGCLSMVTLNNS